ncbi:hypothetical protein ACFLWO_00750 [Chloroflexota bacterium]
MQEELADVYRLIDYDDEARVLVVTVAGRALYAGADERQNLQAVAVGEERRTRPKSYPYPPLKLEDSATALLSVFPHTCSCHTVSLW